MARLERSKRRVWSSEETNLFLQCYKARKHEFVYARKKRFAYSRVLSDMKAQGLTDPSMTPKALENKMRTLQDAYKLKKEKSLESKMRILLDVKRNRKDNEEQRSSCSSIAPYMTEMEEIVGDVIVPDDDHTPSVVDTGLDSFLEDTKEDIVLKYEIDEINEESMFGNDASTSFLPIEISSTAPTASAPPITATSPAIAPAISSPFTISPNTAAAMETTTTTRCPNVNKRKTSREKYYEEKLKILRKSAERKEVQRAIFLDAIEKSFKERSEILQRTEEKKIEMLQKYLNNKSTLK